MTAFVCVLLWAGCSGSGEQATPPQDSNQPQAGGAPGSSPPPGQSPSPSEPAQPPPGQSVPPDPPQQSPVNQPRPFNGPVTAMAAGSNGTVYVSGAFTTYGGEAVAPVIRILSNGQRDQTFNFAGAQTADIKAMVAAPDGKLYVGEEVVTTVGNEIRRTGRVWRVLQNGSVDSAFLVGTLTAERTTGSPQPGVIIFTIRTAGDAVFVGGSFDRYNGADVPNLARVLGNGTPDLSFRTARGIVSNVLPMQNGKVYVVNYGQVSPSVFTSYLLSRLNADGSQDAGMVPYNFFINGILTISPRPTIRGLVPIMNHEDFYVHGSFSIDAQGGGNPLLDPTALRGIARFNGLAGTLDRTEPRPNVAESVSAMAQRAQDQSWIVAHSTTVRRFTAGGQRDTQFGEGTINPGGVISIILPAPDETGDIYMAGTFDTYNALPAGNLVRISSTGVRR